MSAVKNESGNRTKEPLMGKLSGKVAIVTGASKGIGAGIARAFGEEGASVVVNYASSRAGADQVVADIVARGGKAVAVGADVSREDDVRRLFVETEQAFGKVNVLVNNAGVFQFDPLEAVTEAEIHREFDINVLGPILATREAARRFGPRGGSVINIGSVAGQGATPMSVVYSATKAALDSVTRVLAKELGARNIRVNSLNPGPVETEGARAAGVIGSDFANQMIAQTPLGRLGQPYDIGRAAVFFASDDSAWVTGEALRVSGGLG